MNDAGVPPDAGYLSELLDAMDEGVVLHAADGRVVSCNPAAERMLGISTLALAGRTSLFDSLAAVGASGATIGAHEEPAARALRTFTAVTLDRIRIRRPDGETLWLSARSMPILAARRAGESPAVECHGALTLLADRSERVLAEQRLRGELPLDSFGVLAGSVAHDLNHFLTVIVGYADLLADALGPGHPQHAQAEHVRMAALSATRVSAELADFARRQRHPVAVADLVRTIEDMHPLLVRLLGPGVRLELELDRRNAWVRTDSAQLERVLFNLALNARDAMHGSGTLWLSNRPVEIDEAFVRLHPGAQVGAFIRLVVRDDGEGMSAETRARLFEPYFTTKPPGQGTGLGLATVWGVVKQFGGYIEVESGPGQGAEFRIDLPAHAGVADRRVAVR